MQERKKIFHLRNQNLIKLQLLNEFYRKKVKLD
jgi:hypothetical protein